VNNSIEELDELSRNIRCNILNVVNKVGTGHIGSSFSSIELLVSLYFEFMNIDPKDPTASERDRFIMSKGHGAPSLYSVLAHRGYFPVDEMFTLRQFGSRLQGHPTKDILPGIDASTGSLGQGLSIALGMALGLKYNKQYKPNVYCLLGDGEIQEGQNWEAAMASASYGADNLIAIIDRNKLQNDLATEDLIKIEDLSSKFESFGWFTQRVSGHDYSAIFDALNKAILSNKPSCIIADTTKGKGVSFMENQIKWHHHPISDKELAIALHELVGE
jgi:transketolase